MTTPIILISINVLIHNKLSLYSAPEGLALCEAHLLSASVVLCHPHRSEGIRTPTSTSPPAFLQVVHKTRPL